MSENTREVRSHTGHLIRVAQQRHMAIWAQVVGLDTTNVQYGVLTVLDAHPGASQKDICEALELDRSTVADVCVRMEKAGLVSREAAAEDRRRNVLMLTPDGTRELERIRPLVTEVQSQLLGKLDEAQKMQLRGLLLALLGE